MRGLRRRRALVFVVSLLGLLIVALAAVALLSKEDWATRLLQGASVAVEGEPAVFPAANLISDPSVPKGEGLAGGRPDTPVVLNGLLDGGCEVWGTDAAYPDGIHYIAGTLDLVVDGVNVQAYSIDVTRIMHSGDAYQASLYATTETALCPALWIVSNFHREVPGAGLTSAEEGAAIQAAVWHYALGFEPVWQEESWCARQAVYDRAIAMVNAASGQCVPWPARLDLEAQPAELLPGQKTLLRASVYDQQEEPIDGQKVLFTSTLGDLARGQDVTDRVGRAFDSLELQGRGTALATGSLSGAAPIASVDPVGQPFQRLLALIDVPYTLDGQTQIVWEGSMTIMLASFQAAWLPAGDARGLGILISWQTAAETGNAGFNLYRGGSAQGPWTPLNQSLIPSHVPAGSGGGANYEWIDSGPQPGMTYCYFLEDVDAAGVITPHEVVCP